MQSHKMTESFPEIELKIEIEEIQELKENAENINTQKKNSRKTRVTVWSEESKGVIAQLPIKFT